MSAPLRRTDSFYIPYHIWVLLFWKKDTTFSRSIVFHDGLSKVSEWLNANKLTLNAKKSNYVIFRPYQHKLGYSVNIEMFDNSTHTFTSLECKILEFYWIVKLIGLN